MKKEKRSTSVVNVFQDSMILSALFRFFEKTRFLLAHGFFARVFTAYSEEERRLGDGLFSLFYLLSKRWGASGARVKRKVARAFEDSLLVRWLDRSFCGMLYWRMRTYGAFLLSLGMSGGLVYVFREFIVDDILAWNGNWIFPLGAMLLSVPFLMCQDSLATAIEESRILRPIFFHYFGFSRTSFFAENRMPKLYGTASAFGIALGVLTYFISPICYLAFFGILVGLGIVLRVPEFGVLLLIASVPFLHYTGHATYFLAMGVLATDMAYFVKWIRGKRIFQFELMDCAVVVLAGLFVINGLVSVGGAESLQVALLYAVFLSAYFLVVNLFRSRAWLRKAWLTLLFSGSLSCAFGITEIFTGDVNASWVDMKSFSQTVRITGGFENPNVYAEYLLILVLLSFLYLLEQKTGKEKIFGLFTLAVLLFCLVNTWSRGAWLGLAVALIVYFLIVDKRSPVYLVGVALSAPIVTLLIPKSILARVLSIGNLSDSSVSYRFSVWKGVLRMLSETLWCGVGTGHSAFSSLYSAFAYGGSVGIRHAHSLYLQIVVEFGIIGFLIVAAVLFIFVQMCFQHFVDARNDENKRLPAACVSSVVGLLIMGVTDHIWYDYRIFFCFWILIALASAYARIDFAIAQRRLWLDESTARQASIMLEINDWKRGIEHD